MKIKYLCLLLPSVLVFFALLSCGNDDDKPECKTFSKADSVCFCASNPSDAKCNKPVCNTFSKADSVCFCALNPIDAKCNKPVCNTFSKVDSVCFCTANPNDVHCKPIIKLSVYTEDKPDLTPASSNGTLWCKGFVIGQSIYLIDRESASPHGFWTINLKGDDVWVEKADFPGTKYGLTGSANGKGYVSSSSSKKFWEYDPIANTWTPLADLPFAPAETHWVEYKGKFYVPQNNGIYEFNPTTKEWIKISDQTSTGFGALFLIGDDMYWYNINDDFMNNFNLASKAYSKPTITSPDFGANISFFCPFVLGSTAFIVDSNDLWTFDNTSKTWTYHLNEIKAGSAWADDAFVIEGRAFVIQDGVLMEFKH